MEVFKYHSHELNSQPGRKICRCTESLEAYPPFDIVICSKDFVIADLSIHLVLRKTNAEMVGTEIVSKIKRGWPRSLPLIDSNAFTIEVHQDKRWVEMTSIPEPTMGLYEHTSWIYRGG